ncbi:RNA-binding domain-containing protein [Leptospira levettii]|uniref:RNA-binding domain-containing protein n=1 Tax=Leptospira levettii TaxID=2023178 RepID=UPI0010830E37|nr:RNA-binding domain-containing protein [Leptospira levettii]TGL13464.1 ATP-dependent DNA helicase RecG [Leptospira levettii]
METIELIEIISRGEDSKTQFKENIYNAESLAQEIVALSNTEGGQIIIGVNDKTLQVKGLSKDDIHRINQLLSGAAENNVKPSINPLTENVSHPNGLIMVITIAKGINKPYMDNKGIIWVKNGSNKGRVSSREEIQRMFQESGLIHGDEIPANGMGISDVDFDFFSSFFLREFEERIENQENSLQKILNNMNLAKGEILNIAGALLFSRHPQYRLPSFIAKAVSFPNESIESESYIESRDIVGRVSDIFQQSISFILSNIPHIQNNQSINSVGEPMVPKIVWEELIANALIHRDYFIQAPIRILVFKNRVEIITPGHLPNNLTIENIKSGNSNIRNPIMASFATKLLPYRGIGSGIRRALKAYPRIEFFDDRENNLFKSIIYY